MPSLYDVSESCNHAFTHDTGVCMSCGMSEASVRLGAAKAKPVESAIPTFNSHGEWEDHVRTHGHCRAYVAIDGELWEQLGSMGAWRKHGPLPKDDVGIPYDPSAWAKLAESFDQREPCVAVNPGVLPPGTKVNGFSKETIYIGKDGSISRVDGWLSQPMTKTEAQLHHLTSVLGSREKALDAWKAAHLGARAIKNARAEADHLDDVAIDREVNEMWDAQTLQHAMSRPIAAEKSMRAQVLLRED